MQKIAEKALVEGKESSKLGDTEVSGRWQWVRAAQQLDVSLFFSHLTQMNRQYVSSLEVGCMPASHVVRFQLMSSRCPSTKQIQKKKYSTFFSVNL